MEIFEKDYSLYVDSTVLIILVLSTFFSFYRGIVKEVLGFGSWVLASLAVIYAIPISRPFTEQFIDNKMTADILVGVATAISVLVICTLITHKSTSKIRNSALSGLDRILGAIFGIIRGVLIVIILYLVLLLVVQDELENQTDDSFFRPYIEDITDNFHDWIDDYGKEENNLDDLFEKLNEPEIKAKVTEDEGYKDKERKSLDQLIMETSE